MRSETYVPDGEPFHVEDDGFAVYRVVRDGRESFKVVDRKGGHTYGGDLRGCVRFIERERAQRGKVGR